VLELAARWKERGEGKPETFTFLGFTHYYATPQERNPHRRAAHFEKANGCEAQSSKPSRLSFNAERVIAWPRSMHGSERLCWVITNTTQSPETRLSCASLSFVIAGYGRVFTLAQQHPPDAV
jgi:hypothetical protein